MRVNSVASNYYSKNFPLGFNKSHKIYSKYCADCFEKKVHKTNNVLSFRGKPWMINYDSLGIYEVKNLLASEVIKVYEKLKLGNYLDINHSLWFNSPQIDYSDIRQHNLKFLDAIKDSTEKEKFVEYYKNLTGFPDLAMVSSKIKNEFITAIDLAENNLSYRFPENATKIVRAGFNPTCSIKKDKAFPGSDIDGAYVIIKGTNDLDKDEMLINEFKGQIWHNTDQRILSYNHEAAFPNVYSTLQLTWLMHYANRATNSLDLHSRYITYEPNGWDKFWNDAKTQYSTKYKDYLQLKKTYHSDYKYANQFFVKFLSMFSDFQSDIPQYNSPNKELMKNFGFLIETIKEGSYFTKYEDREKVFAFDLLDNILKSDFSDLVNLCQIRALYSTSSTKSKIFSRESLQNNFNFYDIDKQYDIVKTIIKASCGENESWKYQEYLNPGVDNITPLIRFLKKGY